MGWVKTRIRDPILGMLRHGLSPKGLAWSLAAGLALGIIPLLGTSTALCVGVALAFRLNQPAMQLANYLAYPLQILLLFPFIRMGEGLFGTRHQTISLAHIQAALRADAWGAIQMFWTSLWHASVVWLLVVPIPMVLLAWGLTRLFRGTLDSFRRP
jgi:uncharacterized protein (DUF2062 family)